MAGDDGNTPGLSAAVVDDLLADRRRRYLLYCLFRCANPVSLSTVAECVTAWELQTPPENVPDERLRVYMSLYHDHLPKCENAGVVAYSQAEDVVELTPAADHLEPSLERAAERDLAPPDREW